MLAIRHLAKSYGGVRPRSLLDDISLDLAAGEYIAVVGESGVGKSTLLNLIAGLDTPDRGSINFDNVELAALNDVERTLMRRNRIGFVFQAFHLLPHLRSAKRGAATALIGAAPRLRCALPKCWKP
jgi:putative ABC transport system ATP-binding protein